MTGTNTTTRAARTPAPRTRAGAGAAALLALAGPAVSFLPPLTTNVHGSGAAVSFPHGYPVMLLVTITVTAVACALGGLVAGRGRLAAIPLRLALWAVIGFAVTLAGASLGHHAHLTGWKIALMTAVVAGAAARRTTMTTGTRPVTLIRTASARGGGVAAGPRRTHVAKSASTRMPRPAGGVTVVAAAMPQKTRSRTDAGKEAR